MSSSRSHLRLPCWAGGAGLRGLALAAVVAVPGAATAQPEPSEPSEPAPLSEPASEPLSEPAAEATTAQSAPEASAPVAWTDQGLGGHVGVGFGGRSTPGGIRLAGSYLYRLSERDWFDGAAAFTIGSADAACYRDRNDDRQCDHGAVDGFAVDFAVAVRRTWLPDKRFAPFLRAGFALRFARFSGDELAGVAVPLLAGGGVLVDASSRVRIVAAGQAELGVGAFARGLGAEPQLGIGLTIGFEVALR